LPNSAGEFTKFCGLPQQNCPNSAVYRSLPFVRKLSFILFLKTLKEIIDLFFFSKVQFVN